MQCSHCGICCGETEMLLSEADIQLLERAGYTRKGFVEYDFQGFAKLRNSRGHCVFYDGKKRRCKAYKLRPLGCRIYPVVYSDEQGMIVDSLCSMKLSVSKAEIELKSPKLKRLLKTIDRETRERGSRA